MTNPEDSPDGPGSGSEVGDSPDEARAVEAFKRLGLTGYQAKVFIALHRLGSGTARDVSRVTDVPRSQVYSAAEALADRGLASVQQSSPMRYRPVGVETARSTLRERFDRESRRAFDYVKRVQDAGGEQREDIWTVRGRDAVTDRVLELVAGAEHRVLFGSRRPELVPPRLVEGLSVAAEEVAVTVVSRNEAVRERLAAADTLVPPTELDDDRSGRLLFVDDDVALLSVIDAETTGTGPEAGVSGVAVTETAIWSAHTSMATVLVRIAEARLGVE